MGKNVESSTSRSTPSLSRGTENWHVYIAVAKTKRYYTGISPDVENRIEKHNRGEGSRFAKQQGGLVLVYKSESFPSKSEARKREAQIKKWSREKKERLIKNIWK
ncbi:MAG: GIY-YIG catalytic domain protein [Parcubacteria group bacterium GW2011_GWC1_45_14]|nr:MAG: GIY-YIG catalytic domain protein [Parcubacteria group bacterium GW2011_GWC1_45_14]